MDLVIRGGRETVTTRSKSVLKRSLGKGTGRNELEFGGARSKGAANGRDENCSPIDGCDTCGLGRLACVSFSSIF